MNTTIQLHSNILAKVKFFSKQLQLKLHKSTGRKLALQGEETIALSIFKQTPPARTFLSGWWLIYVKWVCR
ncbi:MAG: hypothetical protein UU71_C0036G0001, partial [Parcubacteria group bacterium GW2011_GWB1_41_6]|uniref:Uncharacterized protein n=1 Tax=Candidatus Nomurabacteria bacterium RIFCSPLOWO2_02_FULL_40_67 TaxID=1801787 RepID=A0A1F6Y543_9BACT